MGKGNQGVSQWLSWDNLSADYFISFIAENDVIRKILDHLGYRKKGLLS